jgi:Domain of unknown function (DUF4177)
MTSYRPFSSTLIAGSVLLAATSMALPSTAARADTGRTVVVTRGGPVQTFPVNAPAGGEGLLSFTTSAPGADWGVSGREAGVADLLLDGQRRTDLVVPSSSRTQRSIGLGALSPGRHIVTVRFDGGATPALSSTSPSRTTAISCIAPVTHQIGVTMFEYKVITERDSKFSGKFDLTAVESTLNDYARQGWRLAEGFVAADLAKAAKAEIVLILERSTPSS